GAARSLCEESLAIRRELGDRLGIATSLALLGETLYLQGEAAGAESHYQESLTIRWELGDRLGITEMLEALAELACGDGQEATDGCAHGGRRAARLLGAAEALREAIGVPIQPYEQEEYRRRVDRAGAMLDKEAFAAAWAEGRATPVEQAIAYALGEITPGTGQGARTG